MSVEVALFHGELEVQTTGTDDPLAEVMLTWTCDSPGFELMGMFRTDPRGIVQTELPPGRYRISSDFPPGEGAVEVEWSSSGPVPRTIELSPADQ